MPPLVRHFPTGHALVQPNVPWYEATVAYVLLVPAVVVWCFAAPIAVGYSECLGVVGCGTEDVLASTTERYDGIIWTTASLLALSVLAAALVQLTVRRLHFLLVWSTALLSLVLGVLAYAVISGEVGTPWGQLVQGDVALGPPGG